MGCVAVLLCCVYDLLIVLLLWVLMVWFWFAWFGCVCSVLMFALLLKVVVWLWLFGLCGRYDLVFGIVRVVFWVLVGGLLVVGFLFVCIIFGCVLVYGWWVFGVLAVVAADSVFDLRAFC